MGTHDSARKGKPLRLRGKSGNTDTLDVTVPAWVVRELGWEAGDWVTFEPNGKSVTLRPANVEEVMGK